MQVEYYIPKESFYRLLQFFLLSSFYVLMQLMYVFFIIEYFQYMGFSSNGVEIGEIVYSSLFFLFSCIYLYVVKSGFLRIVCAVFQVFFLIPNLILWVHMQLSIIPSLAVLLLIFLLSWETLNIPKINSIRFSVNEQILVFVFLCVLVFIPFATMYDFHFTKSVFTFSSDIYEIRKEASMLQTPFLSYLISPYVKVLLPMFIAYAVLNNKKIFGLIGFALMILMYALIPHKSIFFSSIVVLVFAFIKTHDKQLIAFLSGLLIMISIGIIATNFNQIMLNSILVRRVFFLPAYLNYAYLDFFKDNLYYSYSFLSAFNTYNYPLDPAQMIALEYYGSREMNANTGFLVDTLINIGALGLFLVVVIIALLFKFLDALQIHPVYFGLYLLFIITLQNSSFFTSMLTHGGLALLVLSVLFLNKTEQLTLNNSH